MNQQNNTTNPPRRLPELADQGPPLHPAWTAFIRFCRDLGHGEIEQLKVQDGLPIIAEKVRQKIKFTG